MPKHKLRKAQEKFFRLRENIVPHLMAAIKNLQYTKGFYPMPDVVSFRLLTLGTMVRWLPLDLEVKDSIPATLIF